MQRLILLLLNLLQFLVWLSAVLGRAIARPIFRFEFRRELQSLLQAYKAQRYYTDSQRKPPYCPQTDNIHLHYLSPNICVYRPDELMALASERISPAILEEVLWAWGNLVYVVIKRSVENDGGDRDTPGETEGPEERERRAGSCHIARNTRAGGAGFGRTSLALIPVSHCLGGLEECGY